MRFPRRKTPRTHRPLRRETPPRCGGFRLSIERPLATRPASLPLRRGSLRSPLARLANREDWLAMSGARAAPPAAPPFDSLRSLRAFDSAGASPRGVEWRRAGSNRQPLACKASALPIELRPRTDSRWPIFDPSAGTRRTKGNWLAGASRPGAPLRARKIAAAPAVPGTGLRPQDGPRRGSRRPRGTKTGPGWNRTNDLALIRGAL